MKKKILPSAVCSAYDRHSYTDTWAFPNGCCVSEEILKKLS